MKRIYTSFFAVILILSLCPAVHAQEGRPAFSDVPADAWYAGNIDICVQWGLMQGVGDGIFDPNNKVTVAEAMTVCARVHHLFHSGDAQIPTLPDEGACGAVYFTDGKGARVAAFDDLSSWEFSGQGMTLFFTKEALAQLRDGENPLDVIFLVSMLDGEARFRGVYRVDAHGMGQYFIRFPEGVDGGDLWEKLASLDWAYEGLSGHWADNAYVYFEQMLLEMPPEKEETFYTFLEAVKKQYPEVESLLSHKDIPFDADCPRALLANMLYLSMPDEQLEPIRRISALPELDTQGLRILYAAGIVDGVDARGAFDGAGSLTRAQLSAIVARAVEPAHRIGRELPS